MKIGIITLTEGFNYGCKLQNYALRTALNEIAPDAEVFTLNNDTCCGNNSLSRFKHDCRLLIKDSKRYFNERKKLKVFTEFNKEFLNFTPFVYDANSDKDLADFSCFVCGSDQIWNPNYVPSIGVNTAYNAPEKANKISYAASIGIESIPESRESEYKKCIGSLNSISVRENAAADLLKKLLNRDVNVVVDPTLLLDRNKWEAFEKKPNGLKKEYLLTYFLTKPDNKMLSAMKKYAEEHDLEIININDLNQPEWFSISPNEFVYLIHHANYFLTDSFHGTVFSLIFHTNFYTFPRNSKKAGQKQGSRVRTLLGMAALEQRFMDEEIDLDFSSIDFSNVDQLIKDNSESSKEFLKKSIVAKDKCISLPKDKCVGCGACEASCPTKAIEMVEVDGFCYPVVSNASCINCGKCRKVCPQYSHMEKKEENVSGVSHKAYCMENADEKIRLSSSSGGIFFELAKKIISEGGVVYSPVFSREFELEHVCIDSMDKLPAALGSKYVQSKAWKAYADAKTKLDAGVKVLFTGTPCQIAALKAYLGKDYDNLFTQDLICHGASSKKYFDLYREELSKKYNKKVENFYFRNKDKGWSSFCVKAVFEDGTTLTEICRENSYFSLFLRNYILRPSCYSNCFSRYEERKSDITLADFWGIKEHDNKGTSLVLTHTAKGEELMKSVRENMRRFEEVDFEYAKRMNSAYDHDVEVPFNKKSFDKETNISFDNLFAKYVNLNVIQKIERKVYRLKK